MQIICWKSCYANKKMYVKHKFYKKCPVFMFFSGHLVCLCICLFLIKSRQCPSICFFITEDYYYLYYLHDSIEKACKYCFVKINLLICHKCIFDGFSSKTRKQWNYKQFLTWYIIILSSSRCDVKVIKKKRDFPVKLKLL